MRNDSLPWFAHSFFILAPSLNYEYRLLVVTHGVNAFEETHIQCPLYRDIETRTKDSDEFVARLREILGDEKIRRVIDSIYGQARAASQGA